MVSIEFSHEGSRGRGWWEKRDRNRGSGDTGVLMSHGHCFFKSIFSMADSSGHSSGKKKQLGGMRDLCSALA